MGILWSSKTPKTKPNLTREQKIRGAIGSNFVYRGIAQGAEAAKKGVKKGVESLEKAYEEPIRGAKKYKKQAKQFWKALG
jgi:hypothetical protein